SGQYVGHVTVTTGGRGGARTDAELAMQVTSGTGDFQGATGTLTGDGSGHFIDEGAITLTLNGSVDTAATRKSFRRAGRISGKPALPGNEPTLSAVPQGDGSLGKIRAVHVLMTHLIVNAGCSN